MSKNIIICLDGTWNDKDDREKLTNVALLHSLCQNDGHQQIAQYFKGVGTDGLYDAKLGGVHGHGVSENIREAYLYLAQRYEPHDQVYLFGFSRGAYTARSLAGFIYQCGLLSGNDITISDVESIYDAYTSSEYDVMAEHKRENISCPIAMIGVWDTVGALGIPVSILKEPTRKIFSFHDTKLSPEVAYACHALAIDEKRESFDPTLWDESEETKDRIHQVWFSGVHSDIGGGYEQRHHSDITLRWMIEHARYRGALIDDEGYFYDDDATHEIHESALKIFGISVGDEERSAPVTEHSIPWVHESVLTGLEARPGYVPRALANHLRNRDTLAPYNIDRGVDEVA